MTDTPTQTTPGQVDSPATRGGHDSHVVPDLAEVASTGPIEGGLSEYLRTYRQRVQGGDMGSLPAVLGLVLLSIVFSLAHHPFFSLGNLANLTTQAAPIVLLAMGLVFILLLGEIDLSAGVTSGMCAAIAALLIHNGTAWPFAVIAAVLAGIVVGLFIGWMRAKVKVPSFVISLALFLALQGVVLWIVISAHTQGNISLESKTLNALENSQMPVWLGWVVAILGIAGYAAYKLAEATGRRRQGLAAEPVALLAIKIGGVAVLSLLFVWLLSLNRAINTAGGFATVNGKIVKVQAQALEGVPWVVPFVIVTFAFLAFMLKRTPYGRHVYAVGGSDEAARRAGINVDLIRISVFVIGGILAAFSGIVLASQIGVNSAEGGGNTLLLAVGAAVIGGTSLFGGKGRVVDAVIGGVVVTVIQNGMSDLVHGDNSAAVQEIVTGAVLALAATVDAISRRRAGASGL